MVKRKLKTSESAAKFSKTDDAGFVPSDEKKEKMVPFDFDERDCDVIIVAKDKKVHIPVDFFKMVSKDATMLLTNGKITIDASSDILVEVLSFYHPRSWNDEIQRK